MTPDVFLDLLATAAPASALTPSAEPAAILRFAGRLHPAVVHFPIGLLITAGVVEVLRRFRGDAGRGISPVGYTCVVVGALAAALAAWLGWINADVEPQTRAAAGTLFWHRWTGVAVAGTALLAAFAGLLVRIADWSWLRNTYRGALILSALLVAGGAYLGGELVHGQGHLLEVFRTPAPASAPTDAPAPPVVSVVAGTPPAGHAAVQAIFDAHCIKCHGPKRQKAMLRLDAPEHYLGGDPALAVITPGDASASLLIERISLPAGHIDLMPKNGERLTDEAIDTVRAWIDAGAPAAGSALGRLNDRLNDRLDDRRDDRPDRRPDGAPDVAPASPGTATIAPAPPANTGPARPAPQQETTDPLGVKPVDAATEQRALAAIRARGGVAGRIAADTSAIDVNLSVLGRDAADADLALLAGLEPSLAWLNLARTGVTNDGLARLSPFTALRRLRLEQTPVGDGGLAHLAGLGRLEYLNLFGTEVTDEGLALLTTLPALKQVYLWETNVTDEGVAGARAVRPDLEIVLGAPAPPPVKEGETGPAAALPACCAEARAAGGECEHECCVAAAKEGLICPKCAAP